MDFIRDLSMKEYTWLPITMIVFFILVGFGIGFWNGWKTAAYFMVWNVVGALTIVLVAKAMYNDHIKTIAEDYLPASIKTNLGGNLDSALALFKNLTVMLIMLAGLVVVNLIALVIYFFIRKHLKREIFLNKKNGISNATTRVLGGGIGCIVALPFASTMGVLSTTISKDEGVNKWVSGMAKISTFGQVSDSTEDIRRIYSLALAADSAQELIKVFSAGTVDANSIEKLKDNKEAILNILKDSTTYELAKQVIGEKADSSTAIGNVTAFTGSHADLKGIFQGATTEQMAKAKELIKVAAPGSANDDTKINALIDFLFKAAK